MDKIDLLARIKSLHSIIECINEKNCYDEVVKFFKITSELQDHSEEFESLLPAVEGFEFHGLKSSKRRQSEINRKRVETGLNNFLIEINKAGRNGSGRFGHRYGHNRTNPEERITKNNIYFGDMTDGAISLDCFMSIYCAECIDDEMLQSLFRKHVVDSVKSFASSFNADWLM